MSVIVALLCARNQTSQIGTPFYKEKQHIHNKRVSEKVLIDRKEKVIKTEIKLTRTRARRERVVDGKQNAMRKSR